MPTITRLETQKHNPERLNVYLDEQFAFGLALNAALTLKVGQTLTQAQIDSLLAHDTLERAYTRALNYLAYRARSEREVRTYLKRATKAYTPPPDDIIETVLTRLRDRRYLNDRQFAQDWVSYRGASRPSARRLLALELRQKGIPTEEIDTALAEHDDDAAALAAAAERAPKLTKLDFPTFRLRLSQYLGRRGFTYDAIDTAVRQAWSDLHPDAPYPD